MNNKFAEKLKELRLEKGLTQEKLARILNINRTVITRYELGIRVPDLNMLIDLAIFFNVSTDFLLGLED